MERRLPAVLAPIIFLVCLAPAHASQIQVGTNNFQCIVATPQCSLVQPLLTMEILVNDADPLTEIQFSFNNNTPSSALIHVYFEDDASLFMSFAGTVTNGTGVNFSQDSSPANLPGRGNLIPAFVTDASFSSDTLAEGLDPGESLRILFNLDNGVTVADILNDLDNDTLRVAIRLHQGTPTLISIGDAPLEVAPEPASCLLVAGSLGLIALVRRSRNRAR